MLITVIQQSPHHHQSSSSTQLSFFLLHAIVDVVCGIVPLRVELNRVFILKNNRLNIHLRNHSVYTLIKNMTEVTATGG